MSRDPLSPRPDFAGLLIRLLRAQDPRLDRHATAVSELARAVGATLGIEPGALDQLALAAELHDIGKIAVPRTILQKPGPLTPKEWEVVRRHPVIGERIVSSIPPLRPLAGLVAASHESFDGSGYPDGLAGEAIPLGARVILVCDAFDAMLSDRPYRRPLSPEQALTELRRCAASQFDPVVVEAFLRVASAAFALDGRRRAAVAA